MSNTNQRVPRAVDIEIWGSGFTAPIGASNPEEFGTGAWDTWEEGNKREDSYGDSDTYLKEMQVARQRTPSKHLITCVKGLIEDPEFPWDRAKIYPALTKGLNAIVDFDLTGLDQKERFRVLDAISMMGMDWKKVASQTYPTKNSPARNDRSDNEDCLTILLDLNEPN